jgi:hypothetical protein
MCGALPVLYAFMARTGTTLSCLRSLQTLYRNRTNFWVDRCSKRSCLVTDVSRTIYLLLISASPSQYWICTPIPITNTIHSSLNPIITLLNQSLPARCNAVTPTIHCEMTWRCKPSVCENHFKTLNQMFQLK